LLVAGPIVVSSHVSQDPHGVAPPAQFRTVPLILGHMSTTSPVSVLNSIVVVPPPA
jgi:hypothetical protein